jgi:predicted ribosomally synthesized peptide with SipW-like signal peptide
MMTKRRKVTRASLWTSAISLLLCVAMLAGATFAWFSDTVTSGKNQILAGNLDVELEYSSDMSSWATVEGAENLFVQDTLWEPGHTEVVYLKLTNKGSLAVDWKLMTYAAAETQGVNMAGDTFKLSDYINFAVVPVDKAYTGDTARKDAISATTGKLTTLGNYVVDEEAVPGTGTTGATATSKTYALIAYMPTTVGNVANYKTGTNPPTIDLAIRLEATQAEYEEDSFGKDYDALADGDPDHLEIGKSVTTVETLAGALNTTVTETTSGADNSIVIKKETVNGEQQLEAGGITVTYPSGTVLNTESDKEAGDSTADATQGLVYTSATPSDKSITLKGTETAAVYALTLPVSEDNTTWIKVVEDIGENQKIDSVYHNGTKLTKTSSASYTPAEVETSGDEGYYYYNSSSGSLTLWVHHASNITVKYTGYFNGGKGTADSPYEIATAQQLKNIYYMGTSKSYYYKLTADINVTGANYTVTESDGNKYHAVVPYFVNSTFDGNGKTITIEKTDDYPTYVFYVAQNSTIKNLKEQTKNAILVMYSNYNTDIEDVTISGSISVGRNVGVFVNYDWGDSTTLTMKNCVSKVTMQGGEYNGVFVGYVYGTNPTLTFTNCENKGSLTAERAAMFIGNANTSNIALNVTNCTNSGTIRATSTEYVPNFYCAIGYSFTVNGEDCPYATEEEDAFTETTGVMENTGTVIHGPTETGMGITKNEDGTFTITPATDGKIGDVEVASYKVSVSIYTTLRAGGTNKAYATETIQASTFSETVTNYTTKDAQWLQFVDKEWADAHTNATSGTLGDNVTYTLDGTTYYMIKNTDAETLNGSPKTPQVVTVYAYDANGDMLASATLSK